MKNDLVDIKQTFHVDCFESVEYEDDDFYVYLHFRNDTGYPFYVGKGRKKRAFQKGSRRSNWWNRIVEKHGYTVRVVETFEFEEDALEFEKEMISILKEVGFELVNLTDGGEGMSGYRWTEEHRKKVSESMKASHNRPEVKQKISASNKISHNRPEVKQKMRELKSGENHPNYGKTGEHTHAFKGYAVGINETHFVIFAGRREIDDCGFHPGNISQCILGRRPNHKGFTWTRHQTLNPEDFIGLTPFNELSAERLKTSQSTTTAKI